MPKQKFGTHPDKIVAFIKDAQALAQKHKLLSLDEPQICSISLKNGGATFYVKLLSSEPMGEATVSEYRKTIRRVTGDDPGPGGFD